MNIADINSEIDTVCDSDTTSYPLAVKLRRVNVAYENIVAKIMTFDGNWEFDDTNYTDFPRATTTMVATRHDYAFDTSHLAIESVQVKDSAGIWHLLHPISKDEMGVPTEEYEKTDGMPTHYDKDGQSVLIYPAPTAGATTLSAGLKVHFRRTASIFTSAQVTTGTKVPGFASPFHIVLVYKASLPYCATYKKDRVAWLISEIEKIEGNEDKGITGTLEVFYTRREKDVRNIMTNKGISFR